MIKSAVSTQVLFYIVLAAVGFSAWNMIARKADANQYWTTIIVCVGTLLPVLMHGLYRMNLPVPIVQMILGALVIWIAFFIGLLAYKHGALPPNVIALLLLAGLVNGLGFIFYGQAIGNGAMLISVLLPILFGVMVLFSAFGGVMFFNDPWNMTKSFGVIFVCVGVYLVNQ